MNLQSPKTRFLATTLAHAHAEYASTVAFASAIDAALSQMQIDLSTSMDEATASKRFHMLEGARHFAVLLATIGDPAGIQTATPDDNLPNV